MVMRVIILFFIAISYRSLASSSIFPPLELTLQEAVIFAISHNPSIRTALYDYKLAANEVKKSFSIVHDPLITGTFSIEDFQSPAASNLDGAEVIKRNIRNFNFELSRNLSWGTTLGISLDGSRFSSNSRFLILNPNYQNSFSLFIRQPLLKNRGSFVTLAPIKVASLKALLQKESFYRKVAQIIKDTVISYWDLVEKKEQLEVAREGLKLAKELHQANIARVDAGVMPKVELTQSRVAVVTREEELVRAQSAYEEAQTTLKHILGMPIGEWFREILPTSLPEIKDPSPLSKSEALKKAIDQRWEIREAEISTKISKIEKKVARNKLLPSLDLQISYGYSGTGGDVVVRDPSTGEIIAIIPGSIGDSFEQIVERQFPRWSITLTFKHSIGNTAAKIDYINAVFNEKKNRSSLKNAKLSIAREIDSILRTIRTAFSSYQAATISVEAAEANLQAVKKKLENGITTSFEVMQAQEELIKAKSRAVTAKILFNKNLASYNYATGEIIEEYIDVVKLETLEEFPNETETKKDTRKKKNSENISTTDSLQFRYQRPFKKERG